jgi:lysyl-tRNA synthetase class 2
LGTELSWQPSAPLEVLKMRAATMAAARRFFDRRGVMEVDTPVLGAATATDVHIASLKTRVAIDRPRSFYLQTSPESAMKRMLAAGSGPVFQFARAFRDGEAGAMHNPEFLLLEWYRPGFALDALMDEVASLVAVLLDSEFPVERLSYRDAFIRGAGIDPFTASLESIAALCRGFGLREAADDRSVALDLLLTARVQPSLSPGCVFVYDFPLEQAALAQLRPGNPPVAERFELFVNRVEVANGYKELTDPLELRRRMDADRARRRKRGLPAVAVDRNLLQAMEHGLPDCAGVALGFDRLLCLKAGIGDIRRVMPFAIDRA